MREEELEKIFNNIHIRMIVEQNSGYGNGYSKELQEKIDLYNCVLDLKQALDEIKEYIKSESPDAGVSGKRILEIIEKVSK